MLRVLLCLAAAAAASEACSCLEQTPQQAYCGADWVSRVKINSQVEGKVIKNNFNNIRYAVNHTEVFKKPSALSSMPSIIYGSSVCRLEIANGKEYLLAGGFHEGRLTMSLCGQVRPPVENVWGPILEWRQVPVEFPATMRAFKC